MKRLRPEIACGILALAAVLIGALPHAEGFNDGSRLATVEMLGERGSFAIDDSLFVRPSLHPERPNPFDPRNDAVRPVGTLDMVRIDGRFYSDKPPVPALILGGLYRLWLVCGGAAAAANIGGFCYLCTVFSSGAAYLLAVLSMVRMARDLGLPPLWQFLFAFSFGAGTVALVYTRQVNGHIQLLAASSVVCWQLTHLSDDPSAERLLLLGTAAGLGFALELGTGPMLLALVLVAVAGTTRSLRAAAIVLTSSLPWLALHFAVNFGIGRTFAPLGSVMEYFDYPGSAFGPHNATGTWNHDTIRGFAEYAADLLGSECGFLRFNPTLWLALPAALWLCWEARRSPRARRFALAVACGWPALSWLLYSATSNNFSGGCCSIRWFVPLLAPAYWLLGMLLVQAPRFRVDFLWLSGVGAAISRKTFDGGPWHYQSAEAFGPTLAIGLAGWLAIRSTDALKSSVSTSPHSRD